MLSTGEIKRFITEDMVSEKKRYAAIGQRYYEANHDILDFRMFYYNADGVLVEDETRTNVKISHPYFMELTDQLTAFILSFDDNPIKARDGVEGLQEQLDSYFDEDFWAEISDLLTGAYVKGFDYLFGYMEQGEEVETSRIAFQHADSMGVVEVRAKDTDDNCEYVIYWYIDRVDKGHKTIKRIQVWDDKQVHYFVQVDDGEIVPDSDEKHNPKPHTLYEEPDNAITYEDFGCIPFWRLDYNKKQISGLKPIKGHIDDYDLHACSLSNNLIDFDTPLYLVKGFQGDNLDELQQNIKTKRMIGVDDEGGIGINTIDIPYQARQAKLDLDEKSIYHFGMGLNTYGLKDTNATTNLAIQMMYAGLELKAGLYIKRLKKLIRQLLKVVIPKINNDNGTAYRQADVVIEFKPTMLVNESENIQNEKTKADTKAVELNTILNIAANIGEEETLKAICAVLDLDIDEIKGELKKQAEASIATAQAALDGAAVDPPEPTAPTGAEPAAEPITAPAAAEPVV